MHSRTKLSVLLVIAICIPLIGTQANLLTNPGFEIGASASIPGWTQDADARAESWAARSGTNGLAMYGWTSGGFVYQDVFAGGLSNYTLTAYGFRDNDLSILYYIQMRLEFLDANYELIDFVADVVRGTNQWDLHHLSAPCPPGTALIRCVLSFSGTAGSGGAFKWDDVELTSTPVADLSSVHYCSPSGSMVYPYTNWATASRGIDNAVKAAAPGDTVLVGDGVFFCPRQIDVDRAVTVRSVNGAASTAVNGSGTLRAFYVTDPGAVIDGFTITNCRSTMVASNNYGGGVCLLNGGTLLNCTIVNNVATGAAPNGGYGYAKGGGVYCAVTGLIANCVIAGNTAIGGESSGGGIYCSGNVVVTNCDVSRNTAKGGIQWFYYGRGGLGGGILAINGPRVEGSRITNNVTEAQSSMYPGGSVGAGVYCASATVSRCLISGNLAISGQMSSRGDSWAAGAGAYLAHGGVLENCLVLNNTATGVYSYADAFGAGVYSYGSAQIRSCTIAGNRAYPGIGADSYAGGGIYASYGSVVRNTIIHGNLAGPRGYDNWYMSVDATMADCCTLPAPTGPGNIAADPRLADIAGGDAHLLADSPCIDRGNDATSPSLDLDGAERPLDGDSDSAARADIGAYEAAAGTTTPNLLINGTFETPSAWVFIDDARLEGWAARSGSTGLAMYGWTDGGLVWQDVNAAGTSNYTFSAWGFRDTAFPAGLAVEMKLEFLSDTLIPLVVTQRFLAGTAEWSEFTIGGISPPDTKIVRAVLAFSGTPGTDGAFKWDDAVLLSTTAVFNARYVAAGAGHVYPYTNWAGAATNLQSAIAAASANDTILISNGVYLGESVVDKTLSIRGLGGVYLTGTAAYPYSNQLRVLSVNAGCLLDLRNVTLAGGYSRMGGGLHNAGTLVLKDCAVTGNVANGGGVSWFGYGGGLYNAGTATIERCHFADNRATGDGTPSAGTGYGAGIFCGNGSVLVVKDSVLAGNRAYGSLNYNIREGGSGYGGGIYNDGGTVTLTGCALVTNSAVGAAAGYTGGHGYGGAIYAGGAVTLRSCTLADNQALMGSGGLGGPYLGEGGGLYLEDGAPVVNVDNTVIARNAASTAGPDCRGTLNASGRNLLGSIANCATIGEPAGVTVGVDARLTWIGMHGGSLPSCVPLYGSPLIDQGSTNGVPSFDYRGVSRPIDGDLNGQARNDIGACEYDPQTMDSDEDSLADADEVNVHGSDPLDVDSDNDAMDDAQEVLAGTSPTDDASFLAVENGAAGDWDSAALVVRWSSVGGRQYTLLRSTNLVRGFSVLDSGLSGIPPANTYTDLTATAEGPFFYKVKVE